MSIITRTQCSSWLYVSLLCSLTFLLVACGKVQETSSAPFPTATVATHSLKTYTGSGYSIGYPQGWNITTTSDGTFSATDVPGTAYITIHILENANGAVLPETQIQQSLKKFQASVKSYKVLDVPKRTRIDGDEWRQESVVGDTVSLGQVQYVLLADNHEVQPPKVGHSIVLVYGTTQQYFEQKNRDIFQPMLRTFHFL